MIGQLFPEQFDNTFRGHKAALWIFGFLLLLKITMGANSTFNGANVAANADGIPLARYSADAARTIVVEFSLLGIANLALCLIGVLALARYRSMVPLLFALFLAEFLSRRETLACLPTARPDGLRGWQVAGLPRPRLIVETPSREPQHGELHRRHRILVAGRPQKRGPCRPEAVRIQGWRSLHDHHRIRQRRGPDHPVTRRLIWPIRAATTTLLRLHRRPASASSRAAAPPP